MSDVTMLITFGGFDQDIQAQKIASAIDALAFIGIKNHTFTTEDGTLDFVIDAVCGVTKGMKGDTYKIETCNMSCTDTKKLTAIIKGCGWSVIEPS